MLHDCLNPIGGAPKSQRQVIVESGSFRPWVVSPGRFALGRFALVFGVGRFALIRWVVSPVSRFARESFRPGSFRPNIL